MDMLFKTLSDYQTYIAEDAPWHKTNTPLHEDVGPASEASHESGEYTDADSDTV